MKSSILFLFSIILINSVFAICNDSQININNASLEELDKIVGIGSSYAKGIIEARPFNSLEDLIRVKGIGNLTLEKIKFQNLACINEERIENKTGLIEESLAEETSVLEVPNMKIEEEISSDSSNLEIISLSHNNPSEVLNINPKTIKTLENSSFQDKGKYIYLLGGFCVLIIILYLIQNKGKRKNEFR